MHHPHPRPPVVTPPHVTQPVIHKPGSHIDGHLRTVKPTDVPVALAYTGNPFDVSSELLLVVGLLGGGGLSLALYALTGTSRRQTKAWKR